MSVTCVSPTYTEVEAEYMIFPPNPPPCLPDAVTEVLELTTESDVDVLAEDGSQITIAEV